MNDEVSTTEYGLGNKQNFHFSLAQLILWYFVEKFS